MSDLDKGLFKITGIVRWEIIVWIIVSPISILLAIFSPEHKPLFILGSFFGAYVAWLNWELYWLQAEFNKYKHDIKWEKS